MLQDDARDEDELGEIGHFSEKIAGEAMFWRLVCTIHMPPAELDRWTLGEMRSANAFLNMQQDYKRAWSSLYEMRRGGG